MAVIVGEAATVLAGAGVVAVVADDADDHRPAVEASTGAGSTSTTLALGELTTSTTPAALTAT